MFLRFYPEGAGDDSSLWSLQYARRCWDRDYLLMALLRHECQGVCESVSLGAKYEL